MMNSNRWHFCHLLFVCFCLLVNHIEANKKLQRIILASLIGKSLKSHMHHSVVPIMMPPFKSMDKHVEMPHNGLMHNNGLAHNNGLVQNNGLAHNNGLVHSNQIAQQGPTITVHHYHHHSTSHDLVEPIYSKYDESFDGTYNHLSEPIIHQDYHSYASHDQLGGLGFKIGPSGGGGSILSGSLGGNVGNILSGQIGGQIG